MKLFILVGLMLLAGGLCAAMKEIPMKITDNLESVVADVKDLRELGNFSDATYWDIRSSSHLKTQKGHSYDAAMVNDGRIDTAWVEGAAKQGVGEYLEFVFTKTHWEKYGPVSSHPFHAIGKIVIVNGYAKTEETWSANSRVKTFKVYLNENLLFLLQLQDSRDIQTVYLDSAAAIKIQPEDRLRFEIAEIYPGRKFSDTAITEIVLSHD